MLTSRMFDDVKKYWPMNLFAVITQNDNARIDIDLLDTYIITNLSYDEQNAIELHYKMRLSYKQMVDFMDHSKTNIAHILSNAIKKLRNGYSNDEFRMVPLNVTATMESNKIKSLNNKIAQMNQTICELNRTISESDNMNINSLDKVQTELNHRNYEIARLKKSVSDLNMLLGESLDKLDKAHMRNNRLKLELDQANTKLDKLGLENSINRLYKMGDFKSIINVSSDQYILSYQFGSLPKELKLILSNMGVFYLEDLEFITKDDLSKANGFDDNLFAILKDFMADNKISLHNEYKQHQIGCYFDTNKRLKFYRNGITNLFELSLYSADELYKDGVITDETDIVYINLILTKKWVQTFF